MIHSRFLIFGFSAFLVGTANAAENSAGYLAELQAPEPNHLRFVFPNDSEAFLFSRNSTYHIDCSSVSSCVVRESSTSEIDQLTGAWKSVLVADLGFRSVPFDVLMETIEMAKNESEPIDLRSLILAAEGHGRKFATRAPTVQEASLNIAMTFGTMAAFFLVVGSIADAVMAQFIVGPHWFHIPKTWTIPTNMAGLVAALGYIGVKIGKWRPLSFSTALKASAIHTFGGTAIRCAALLAGLVP